MQDELALTRVCLDRYGIQDWACPRFSTSGFTVPFYEGDLPSTGLPGQIILVSGEKHHFTETHPSLRKKFGANGEMTETREVPQSLLDALFRGLRVEEGLEPIVNAYSAETQQGMVHGFFAAVPLLPRFFLNRSERSKVLAELIHLAQVGKDRGAERIVLGALTKIDGLDAALAEADILPVATGNRLTALIQTDHIHRVVLQHDWVPHETVVAIVGATGSVGRALALELAGDFPLCLVGRQQDHLDILRAALERRATYPIEVIAGSQAANEACLRADIVIFLTTGFQLDMEHMPGQTHLIDAARPHAIRKRLFLELGEQWLDDGGLVSIPGLHVAEALFHLPSDALLPCTAEGIPLAVEGCRDHFGVEPLPHDFPWSDQTALEHYLAGVQVDLDRLERVLPETGLHLYPRRTFHSRVYD